MAASRDPDCAKRWGFLEGLPYPLRQRCGRWVMHEPLAQLLARTYSAAERGDLSPHPRRVRGGRPSAAVLHGYLSYLRGDTESVVGGMCRGARGGVDQTLRRESSGRESGCTPLIVAPSLPPRPSGIVARRAWL